MINGNDLVRYFSKIEGERYYSEYEVENLYERAFSDGYYFAQREFGLADNVRSGIKKAIKNTKDYGGTGIRYIKGITGNIHSAKLTKADGERLIKAGDFIKQHTKRLPEVLRKKIVDGATGLQLHGDFLKYAL